MSIFEWFALAVIFILFIFNDTFRDIMMIGSVALIVCFAIIGCSLPEYDKKTKVDEIIDNAKKAQYTRNAPAGRS